MSATAHRHVLALLIAGVCLAGRANAQLLLADPQSEFEQALAAFDLAQEMRAGGPDQARQLFRSAAQRLESIAASGVANGRLEYNLGNCHLQAGDLGRAILHYRRAQRLIPGDPLLSDNLKVARSRCLTPIQPTRRSAFLHGVFFLHYDTSVGTRARAAILLYLATWVLLALRNFVRRRWVAISATVCGVIGLTLGASIMIQRTFRSPASVSRTPSSPK